MMKRTAPMTQGLSDLLSCSLHGHCFGARHGQVRGQNSHHRAATGRRSIRVAVSPAFRASSHLPTFHATCSLLTCPSTLCAHPVREGRPRRRKISAKAPVPQLCDTRGANGFGCDVKACCKVRHPHVGRKAQLQQNLRVALLACA